MNVVLDGRYKIIKKIGKGGFGCTYLAQNLSLPEMPTCVIKHLKPRIQHPSVLQLFQTEAKVLDRLDHQQIPHSTDWFEKNGEVFLVQDFIDGNELGKECLRGRQWSEAEIRIFLRDLLEILRYVHQHSIVHRDIKPDNIIQRKDNGKFVLIDFGAVQELNPANAKSLAQPELIVGTAGYRSPEQLRGETCFSSDIYGLGVTTIQLLTLTHPQYLQTANRELVWRERAMVSDELANIIDRMICPQVVDRYQSAAAVLADLEQLPIIAEKVAVNQEPAPPTHQLQPLKILLSAAIGLGLVGASWLASTNPTTPSNPEINQIHP